MVVSMCGVLTLLTILPVAAMIGAKLDVSPGLEFFVDFENLFGNFKSENMIVLSSIEEGMVLFNDDVLRQTNTQFSLHFYTEQNPIVLETLIHLAEINAMKDNPWIMYQTNNASQSLEFLHVIAEAEEKSTSCEVQSPRPTAKFIVVISSEICGSSIARDIILDIFKEAADFPSVGQEVYLAFPSSPCTDQEKAIWTFFEIYELNGKTILLEIQSLNGKNDAEMAERRASRSDLNGITINVAIPDFEETKSSANFTSDGNGTRVIVSGLSLDILKDLQFTLNFTRTVHISNIWPTQRDGKWIGMGKLLCDKTVEFIAHGMTYEVARAGHFTFAVAHLDTVVSVYFQQPPISSIRNVYVNPFRQDLWIATICLIKALLLILFFLKLLLETKWFNIIGYRCEEILQSPSFLVVSVMCQQGFSIEPIKPSTVVLFLTLLLISSLLMNCYSAALFSSLSATVVPIKTYEDLLNSSLHLVADSKSASVNFVLYNNTVAPKNSTTEHWALKIYDSANVSTGIKRVITADWAYMTYPARFYTILLSKVNHSVICSTISRVDTKGRYGNPFKMGLLMRKHSPYKEVFARKLVKIWESGLRGLYRSRAVKNFFPLCDPPAPTLLNLGVLDVLTGYVIILSGFIICIVVGGLEIAYFKIRCYIRNKVLT